ncbi:MAG: InlB B-repeat-containing protein, partial [Lachnospiraceae bacterium]|nr:InlB B-repeat-containing protein [Lachnospiraceae bacterium]
MKKKALSRVLAWIGVIIMTTTSLPVSGLTVSAAEEVAVETAAEEVMQEEASKAEATESAAPEETQAQSTEAASPTDSGEGAGSEAPAQPTEEQPSGGEQGGGSEQTPGGEQPTGGEQTPADGQPAAEDASSTETIPSDVIPEDQNTEQTTEEIKPEEIVPEEIIPEEEIVEEVEELEEIEELEEEEEIKMPAQTFRAESGNGVQVVARVKEGVFPEDTTLYVRSIAFARARSIADAATPEDTTVTDAIAVDITFRDKDFNEIQPANGAGVSVEIKLNKALDGEEFKVIHAGDDGNASVIADAGARGGSFVSGSFSIYVVAAVEQTDPRLEVRFFMPGESEPYNTQFVASGEDLHDPGTDLTKMSADDVFVGWSVNGTEVPDIEGLKALVPSSVEAGEQMDVTAVIHVERRLVYERIDGKIKHSEDYIVPKDPGTKDVVVNQSYTVASGNLGFVGWAMVDAEGNTDESTIYKNGDTITLSQEETILRPVVREGFWLIFDENDGGSGGGASFTDPVFCMGGTVTSAQEPEDPTRPGYDFAGWHTDPTANTPFTFNTTLTADQTLYAHWTPSTNAEYTVIVWMQDVNDDKDAADADKTYDYYSSAKVTATTGATISASDLSAYTGLNVTGFDYRTYEIKDGDGNSTTVVGAQNDTVVNVYYDRELWTIQFYVTSTDNYATTPEQYREVGTNIFRTLTWSGRYWQYNGSNYTGTRYKVSQTMTGLYGQSLAQNGYTWPSGRWEGVSFVDAFDGNLFGASGLGGTARTIKTRASTTAANVTIINYVQDAEDETQYTEALRSSYTFSNGSGYRITDRFSGFEVSGYKWSNSESMPTSWDTGINETGYTEVKKTADDTYIHVKFDRARSSLIFQNGTDVVKTIANIPYGKSLSPYESEAPTVSPEDGQFFTGWYEDPEFVTPMNWATEKMPSANKVVYARTIPERFRIVLDFNGGTIPAGQTETFRKEYGTTIASTGLENTTKENHSLLGWYDEDGNLFNFNTRMSESIADMSYQTNAELRAQYGDNDAAHADVVGLIRLHAEWRDDTLDNQGGIGLRYVDDDGTTVLHPERPDHRYLDMVTAVAQALPDATATKHLEENEEVFVGWKVGETTEIVPAGDLITVRVADAVDMLPDDPDNYNWVVTLTAVYQHESEVQTMQTKLTYKAGGGTGADVTVDKLAVNGKVATWTKAEGESAFTKDGYVLAGWSKISGTDPDSDDVIDFGADVYIDNKNEDTENILYAVWRRNTFTVTWKNDGGAVLETDQNVPYGTVPSYGGATPTKAATAEYTYTFAGWSPEVVAVTGDATYTATYNETTNQYTVTYALNGGTVAEGVETSYTVDYGTETPTITTTRTGYTFSGWNPAVAQTVTGNVTYTAQWEAADVTYTVKHLKGSVDGYAELDSYPVTAKTDETRYAEPHNFEGYEIDWPATAAYSVNTAAGNTVETETVDGEQKLKGTVQGDGSLVLALVYKRSQYTVTYKYIGSFPNGMNPAADTTTGIISVEGYNGQYTYGDEVTVKEKAQAPDGYTVEKWHAVSGSDLDISGGTFEMPARNVTLVASVTPNADTKYTVTHWMQKLDASGNVIEGEYEVRETYPYTGTTGTIGSAHSKTYEGLTFDKTTTLAKKPADITSEETGSDLTLKGTIAGDESLELNFYYTRNSFNVTYVIDGYTPHNATGIPAEATYVYGKNVTVAPAAEAEGYTFDGWTCMSVDITRDNFDMPGHDVTIVGHFTPETNGTKYIIRNYLQKLDGTYEKSDLEMTGTASEYATVNPATFVGYELNWPATKDADENKVAEHDFSFDDNAHSVTGKILAGDEHKLIIAFYHDRMTYHVTYEYDGTVPTGAVPTAADVGSFDTADYKYGEKVTIKKITTVPAGYEFSGFAPVSGSDITPDDEGKFDMPSRNVELIGHFTPNSNTVYTIKHLMPALDGNGYVNVVAPYTRTATTDSSVTASAREFPGVTYDQATTNANKGTNTMSADGKSLTGTVAGDESLELVFYYTRNTYTVSYVYDGYTPTTASALPTAQTNIAFGQSVTIEPDATAQGYSFSGWDVQAHDFDIDEDKFNMPARNVVFHGSFTPEVGQSDFKVQHYVQELNGSYTLKESTTYTGTALETGTGNKRDYDGYSVNWTKTSAENTGHTVDQGAGTISGTILADHSLVIAFYYDRDTYTVTYEYDGEVPAGAKAIADFNTPAVTAKFGEKVTIEEMPASGVPAGYTFSGFAPVSGSDITPDAEGKFDMPSRNVELIGHFTPNSDTVYTIKHLMPALDGNGYVNVVAPYTRTATTDSSVTASAREFAGVTYDPTTTEANKGTNTISADKKSL